jgi:hypothetical protein
VAGEYIVSGAATLAARVEQYLAERRRLGFDLRTMSYSLRSLAEYVRKTRHRGALTVELMAAHPAPSDRDDIVARGEAFIARLRR